MSVVFQIKWRMHHVANGLAEVTVYDRFVEISTASSGFMKLATISFPPTIQDSMSKHELPLTPSNINIYPEPQSISMSEAELTALRGRENPQPVARKTTPGSARETIAILTNRIGVTTPSVKTKKRRPMLTSSQLSDLFTRLDKNGDGELDLDEFTGIIKMLKIEVTPDYVARVFRSVDQAGGNGGDVAGTLDMQEFIAAYQKIYTGATVYDVASAASKRESYIRATRYGCRADGSYVFECYTIPSDAPSEKHTLADLPTNETSLGLAEESATLDKLSKAKVEPWLVDNKPGTMENLDRMIRQDSARNKNTKASVFWWVDCAYSTVDRTTAEDMVAKFGLPNNSKFVSSFGNFGNGLSTDPKSRVFAGNGINSHGSVYSVSYFAQAQFIKNVPVVHHLPPLLRSLQCGSLGNTYLNKASEAVVHYYTSRFAWMANLSWLSRTSNDEKVSAYERAEGLASLFRTNDVDVYDDADDNDTVKLDDEDEDEEVAGDNHTIFSSNGGGVPVRHRAGYNYPPTWLRSNSQIYAVPPQVNVDSISMHILDHGFGAHALLTVRQIDSEKQKYFTLEQQSRAGVLGRITSGVWVKLARVVMSGRNAGAAGELTDSPASLVSFLFMLIHNFSMNSVASVDYWLNVLEKEIKDIVVSKHSAHLTEVERILKDFNSYLDPLEGIMQAMAQEHEDMLSNPRRDEESGDGDEADLPIRVPAGAPRVGIARSISSQESNLPAKNKRRASVSAEAKFVEALPEGVEKQALSFLTISRFFGDHPYREIQRHLDGYEQLDMKGLVYWKERLRKYALKVESLKDLIATQLEEKRNFMSFMLTIITTVLAPLAILTGYFGMNFTNMNELDPSTTPLPKTPGIVLMWVITGVAYGILLVFSLHFRVMYAAT